MNLCRPLSLPWTLGPSAGMLSIQGDDWRNPGDEEVERTGGPVLSLIAVRAHRAREMFTFCLEYRSLEGGCRR